MQRGGRRPAPAAGAGPSGAGAGAGAGAGGEPAAAVDREWLKDQLVRILQWDPFVTEGVVEAVAGAGSQAEVEDIVEVGAPRLLSWCYACSLRLPKYARGNGRRQFVPGGSCPLLLSPSPQRLLAASCWQLACLPACLGGPARCALSSDLPRASSAQRSAPRPPCLFARPPQGFMGGSLPAKQAVLRFWQQAAGGGAGDSRAALAAPPGAQAYRKEERVARAGQAPGGRGAGAREPPGAGSGGGGSRGAAPPRAVELPAPSQPVSAKDGSKVGGPARRAASLEGRPRCASSLA